MRKLKDFITSCRCKWWIMAITFIITVLLSLYVEIKFYGTMKDSRIFSVWLFFACVFYFPWLFQEIYTFILLGSLFLEENEFAKLKDYFAWCFIYILEFLIFNLALGIRDTTQIRFSFKEFI